MKQLATMLFLVMSPLAWGQDVIPYNPPLTLDKINFQMAKRQWVSTQTALLNVNINVNLTSADLVKARSEIMTTLNRIASGDWHLISFERSQDTSGLEKLYVQAQARVDQAALTEVYKNAKALSKPGTNYEVSGVEFKPSLEEVQSAKAALREQLYKQVNDELARINKMFPTQNYSINQLMFLEGDAPVALKTFDSKQVNAAVMEAPAPLAVSNELVLTAVVEAASNRKQGN